MKAIKGGVIAIKGQLLKGSGYLISAKGKLLAQKGDSVTELGKKIASSAILSPHPSHTGPSGHEGKSFLLYLKKNCFKEHRIRVYLKQITFHFV